MSAFGAKPTGSRLARMLASPNFRDGTFRNLEETVPGLKTGTTFQTAREFLLGGQRRTPPGPLPLIDPRRTWESAAKSGFRATWLGHSTVLLELDGAIILTDPVFGERASPSAFVGPKRFMPPPVEIDGLPRLDAVLVSHDHFDHLCWPTIRALAAREVPFVTALGVGAHLEGWGIPPARITELDWGEEVKIAGVSFTATPSRHFSGRKLSTRNGTLWASWVLRGSEHRVFFSGDTGLTHSFKTIGERHGPFDLIMLEVGAFHPNWGDIHLGPENALLAHAMLGGGPFLPIHWGTFNLALHDWDEPAEVLLREVEARSLPLLTPRPGGSVEPRARHPHPVDPWWRNIPVLEKARRRPRAVETPVEAAPSTEV